MSQQLSLLDLGSDIIESEVIPHLSPEDIQSLKLTSKSLNELVARSSVVWHELYKKTFGTKPTAFSLNKWPDLYSLRAKGKLYTWGAMSSGRLGLSSQDVPANNIDRQGFSAGVVKPTQVPGIDDVLADVSAGGFSFQILTGKGEIYSTGSYHAGHSSGPGPNESDHNEFQEQMRLQEQIFITPIRRGGRVINPLVGMPLGNPRRVPISEPQPMPGAFPSSPYQIPEQVEVENKSKIENRFLKRETSGNLDDTKFVSVSSGRSHFIALDTSGNLWSWDGGEYGVKIRFEDKNGINLIQNGHVVLKAAAGWSSSVAYIYNYGLVYWKQRDPLKKDDTDARAHHRLIPKTGDIKGSERVVDFFAGDEFIIYVTAEGKVYRNDMIGEESILLEKFHNHLKLNANSLAPKFTSLSGNFNHFAVFSNEDIVLIGSKNSDEPEIIEELQHKECISLAVGDYHFLALLKDGTVLSWGLESNSCGCLGLGKEEPNFIWENNSRRVRKPTKIDVEGKVVAIAAAGWQSSAIISDV
ncbi:putative E3 ubiquitin-protein ligase HERC2 [Wickerhamomyces ciferrii]|uniref:E3 ubiquitin-protein ligase HERC2 n=1 Tax=Wickerhamomyces ciferrii (strain ATCC 14091 / BCRC 22168 / CBS 111 / JCM 3599 / NBRC 0793 / NRRL Y-1031 F-60-10) TaxID=1206466 RepID=K0KSL6_WICCF|nr:putative E3 ubiquitin-protein ligase HERC2 [Wickerhamomyces ciferrii]CCH44313.1 putative E3 ubiquitin-protein ligase HERC2 [Wickerhamomyces ciferrii]